MNVSQIAGTPLSIGMDLNNAQSAAQAGGDPAAVSTPRAVEPGSAMQFRDLLTTVPGAAHSSIHPVNFMSKLPGEAASFDLDIEKMVLSHLPSADATPAEFALGMLRAQVKVAQAAVGIELAAKTTQSLTQGVQTLTSRG
jgi:hypothetical protein